MPSFPSPLPTQGPRPFPRLARQNNCKKTCFLKRIALFIEAAQLLRTVFFVSPFTQPFPCYSDASHAPPWLCRTRGFNAVFFFLFFLTVLKGKSFTDPLALFRSFFDFPFVRPPFFPFPAPPVDTGTFSDFCFSKLASLSPCALLFPLFFF